MIVKAFTATIGLKTVSTAPGFVVVRFLHSGTPASFVTKTSVAMTSDPVLDAQEMAASINASQLLSPFGFPYVAASFGPALVITGFVPSADSLAGPFEIEIQGAVRSDPLTTVNEAAMSPPIEVAPPYDARTEAQSLQRISRVAIESIMRALRLWT